MMHRINDLFRGYPIRRKLMLFFLLLSSIGILVTSATFLLNVFYSHHKNARQEIKAQASILARNTSAALTFGDQKAAKEILSGLKENPRIVAVALFTADNNIFTYYVTGNADNSELRKEFASIFNHSSDSKTLLARLHTVSSQFNLLEMHPVAVEPVILDNQQVGTVIIQTDLHYLFRELQFLAALTLGVALATFVIAWLLASRFERIISDPIISLSNLMKQVSSEKNYSLRAVSDSADEIGALISGFNEMLQEIQNRDRILFDQQQLLLEEKNSSIRKLTAAVEQSANSIIITTPQGEIEYVNPYFCSITGYTANELIGQNPRILNAGSGSPEKYSNLWQTVLGGGQWTGEFLNRKKSGELFWEQAAISPVLDDHGKITNLIAIKVDITERKQAEEEMRQAKEQAEAANRAKSEFLANMSHEIRTPMNGVIGMSDMLAETPLNDEQRQFTDAIRTSADHLLGIIDAILDFSKIEADKMELDNAPFLLRPFLGTTLRFMAGKAADKGLELTLLVDRDLPDTLEGDSGRLRQILLNLLNNAIKFSGSGEIKLDVALESITDNSLLIRFSVHDQGIGIPEEKIGRIFESFTQADASTSKTYGGTGLGLTISRRLSELMGGRIWVESTPGVGSTFSFTVKLLARENEEQSQVKRLNLDGLTAMVVDDNQTNRLYLSNLLSDLGFTVTEMDCAHSALVSLVSARDNKLHLPDLLLADLSMQGENGYALMESLKVQGGFDGIKRILMLSVGMRGEAGRCRELCVDGYLFKPIMSEEFNGLMNRMFCAESKECCELLPATPHQIRKTQSKLVLLVVDDVEINRMVAEAILERMGHEVVCAGSGKEALELLSLRSFDAVFMDVQMPEMDGLQTTAIIRSQEMSTGGRHMPIIAMTAYALSSDRDRCLGAGMDGYVSKPVKAEKIQEALEQYLGIKVSDDERSVEPLSGTTAAPAEAGLPALPDDAPPIPVFDRAGLVNRLGGEEMVEVFVGKFLSGMLVQMDKLRSELDVGSVDAVRAVAHAIKGLAANIGAEQLRQTALDMETAAKVGDLENLAALHSCMLEGYETFAREIARR